MDTRYATKTLWLKSWIDGTVTQQVDSSAITSGINWQLYDTSLTVLKYLVKRTGKVPKPWCKYELSHSLTKLFLWAEGYDGGRLDKVIQRSECLGNTILEFLTNIARLVVEGKPMRRLVYSF
jgi:hypothetical protein